MPTPRLDPEKVFDVADQLPLDASAIDVGVWSGCGDARLRSSVSRAYYSVFLRLKDRLIKSGLLKRSFPEGASHDKLYRAVRDGLGPNKGLTQKLRVLRSERGRADYELDMEIDSEFAETRLDEAHKANGLVDILTTADLTRIGRKLDGE